MKPSERLQEIFEDIRFRKGWWEESDVLLEAIKQYLDESTNTEQLTKQQ